MNKADVIQSVFEKTGIAPDVCERILKALEQQAGDALTATLTGKGADLPQGPVLAIVALARWRTPDDGRDARTLDKRAAAAAHCASKKRNTGASMSRLSVAPVRAALAALAFALAHPVAAQETYPNRPLLLTHGFGAGGNGDVVSRIIGEAIAPRLGQPVVIEPRPGAGGNTASARLVKSEPDGYTLISLTGGHAVSAAIYKSLPFDPVDDFQFVSNYGYQAFMIAVKKGNAIKTIPDLIAAAKAAPGKLTYSSVGIGSTQHLAGELFSAMAGITMTHVPYRS